MICPILFVNCTFRAFFFTKKKRKKSLENQTSLPENQTNLPENQTNLTESLKCSWIFQNLWNSLFTNLCQTFSISKDIKIAQSVEEVDFAY